MRPSVTLAFVVTFNVLAVLGLFLAAMAFSRVGEIAMALWPLPALLFGLGFSIAFFGSPRFRAFVVSPGRERDDFQWLAVAGTVCAMMLIVDAVWVVAKLLLG